jgi:hypothetical protein
MNRKKMLYLGLHLLVIPVLLLASIFNQSVMSASSRSVNHEAHALLFQDNFEDGDYTTADGPDGLVWGLIAGDASVDNVDGSFQLGLDRGYSLIATNQTIAGDEYTVRFSGRITWSAPGRIVLLYKDANNYYSVGLGEQTGIYRKLDGSEVQLKEDPEDLIRLPHGSGETGEFKAYVHNTGASIILKADKAGDGVDYDLEIVDNDPAAVAMFTNTGVGMMSSGGDPDTPWFFIDNIAIYEGLVLDPYNPMTYYVDQNHPYASDNNPGTEDLPWQTIQKAADTVWAGDTVIVKSGTYPERIRFSSGTRGAPGQLISFIAQPRRSVTMWGFYTQFAHYLHIEGFNITTDPSLQDWTDANGVFIASDHVQVVDNYFYNLDSAGISGESVGAIILNNRIYHSQAGLMISGSGWLVEGNEVERLFQYGNGDCDYARFFGDNHIIRHNFFHGTDFSEIGDAHVDCFQTFDNNGEYVHHVTVDGNVCYDFHQGFMGEAAYYHNMSDITFSNNIFAHGGAWGLCVLEIQNVTAVNNVFADIAYHGAGFRDGATGYVWNNIFYNSGSNYWASEGGNVEGSHNLLFSTDGNINPGDFPNDLVNLDPLFFDPVLDNYHIPASSPAIDAGIDAGLTTDLDGNIRPQGKGYDIGAFEFTPALTLHGYASSQTAILDWSVNVTLSPTMTWTIDYSSPPGDQLPPIYGIPVEIRTYTLSGLTNYLWYTFTLTTDPAWLTDTVALLPTDHIILMPIVSISPRP